VAIDRLILCSWLVMCFLSYVNITYLLNHNIILYTSLNAVSTVEISTIRGDMKIF
jgi:hypothetical protein